MDAPDIRVLSLAVWDDAAAQQEDGWARTLAEVARLLIFTKGWEPPLLEFLDFLDRGAVGHRPPDVDHSDPRQRGCGRSRTGRSGRVGEGAVAS